jgi:hypothetical protein
MILPERVNLHRECRPTFEVFYLVRKGIKTKLKQNIWAGHGYEMAATIQEVVISAFDILKPF